MQEDRVFINQETTSMYQSPSKQQCGHYLALFWHIFL